MKLVSVVFVIAILVLTTPALADGFSGEEFSLRLPAALSRYSTYADVAAVGGASAGSQWSSSVNPASTGWLSVPMRTKVDLSMQYSLIGLSEGSRYHVVTESAQWDTKRWGTWQPAAAQLRTNTAETRDGYDFRMQIDYFQAQWAQKTGKDFAVGANVNVATSATEYDLGPLRAVRSTAESYGFRAGGLWRCCDRWLAGIVLDYGFTRSRTRYYDTEDEGWGYENTSDTGHQFLVRPGVSYTYAEESTVYLDYQFGWFHDETGVLEVHRFYAGVDHRLAPGVFLRAGLSLDTRGNPTGTVGLGYYPNDWFSLDLSLQERAFPELEPDFGRSRQVTISLNIKL